MEIKEMRMADISARLAEIRTEMDAEDANIDALTKEVEELEERKKELAAEETAKEELRKKVAEGSVGTVVAEKLVKEEGRKNMDEREMRAKEFAENGKMECRAVLATGQIAKPAAAGGVSDMAQVASDIVDDVNAIPLTGNGSWIVGYKKTEAAAANVTDGSVIGGTAATFDYVTINPVEWGIVDQVSKQVKKMTPVNYQAAVEKSALIALRSMASTKIVAAIKASTLTEVRKGIALDADFLKNVVLGFRAIKEKGATVLYIAQADLLALGKVRGTNEKKALYEITFDEGTTTSGTIKEGGLATRFRVLDQLTAGEQLFGQPGAVDMPMWDNYEISTDEGGKYFEANQIGIRGLQTAGADLVCYHGMQHIKQSAS